MAFGQTLIDGALAFEQPVHGGVELVFVDGLDTEHLGEVDGLSPDDTLILDVRFNRGGDERLAAEIAGRFVERPVTYALHRYRDASTSSGFSETGSRTLNPIRPGFRGRTVVLMGPANVSSAEAFLLMMRQAPRCTLMGDSSYGNSGNPKPVALANGVTAFLPSWVALTLDEGSLEGNGERAQVIYVWSDALANYISALGYGGDERLLDRYWRESPYRTHVIGKGVTRFHAIYWPAMLLSAGVEPPAKLCVHSYVTVDGQKIGKSLGNTIDPIELAGEVGAAALRFCLLRQIRSSDDGDFSRPRLEALYEAEFANGFGNLLARVLGLVARYAGGRVPHPMGTESVSASSSGRSRFK